MKVFLAACISAVIIAIIAAFVLNSIQEPADKAFTTSAVRLGT
jgi:energy-converting hydrogenase Eha subunit A